LVLAVSVGLGINYYKKTARWDKLNIVPVKIDAETETTRYLQKETKKVNINTATSGELINLPHVGPALAKIIIDYRKQNGPLSKIEDIQKVNGIGLHKFNEIKGFSSVE
jgi:comEA protein